MSKNETVKDGAKVTGQPGKTTQPAKLPFTPKIKKQLTYPQLKLVNNVPIFVKPILAMALGKEMPKKDGEDQKPPPMLMKVVDLTTGRECEIICNKILVSELNDNYPDDTYVGLCFMVEKLPKQGAGTDNERRYNGINVAEIEDPVAKAPAA